MYLTHFGLRARPFRTSPDVDGYYPATTHETALAELRRGLEDGEGLLLLTGSPGIGKTLIAHRLIDELQEGARTVLITHGKLRERTELLQAILFDLGLPYQEMSEQELRLALTESCLEHFRDEGRTIVVADEAHLLPAELLEELRSLGNLEGKEGKAIQVVLLGLPSIADAIAMPGLDIFRQRLVVCCKLEPLGVEESADYLLHQIRRSGGRPEKLFGEDVLDILSHASNGIPRVLNQAANLAFRLACETGSRFVDAEAAVEAVTRLGLDRANADERAEPEEIDQPPDAIPVTDPLPMPLNPSVSIPLERENGPTMYVYGGLADVDDRVPDLKLQRAWQSNPQRAG